MWYSFNVFAYSQHLRLLEVYLDMFGYELDGDMRYSFMSVYSLVYTYFQYFR